MPADEALSFECEDHLVDGGCCDLEDALRIALGRRVGVHLRTGPDDEVPALLLGEKVSWEAKRFWPTS